MSGKRTLLAALILLGLAAPLRADAPTPDELRAAVRKSIALLEKSGAEYLRHRDCFSCHNQGVPIVALTTARARGFEINEEALQRQVQFTADFLARNEEPYRKGRGQGGQVDTAGYALWALEAGGWKANPTTAAVAEYLVLRDRDLRHWRTVSKRPPSEVSHFTTTYLALRGLQAWGTDEQEAPIAGRVKQAREWLLQARPQDTEDRVFRLWALQRLGEKEAVQTAAEELLKSQRADGGWAQADDMESDAYATGSALVALHRAAGLPASDPAYQRGLRFLLRGQLEDGSWLVRSRSRPFQLYFESGFPHGKDQFISAAASAWATTALALACPPPARDRQP
jgi:squalene cyclase